jgi:hypothetical protein
VLVQETLQKTLGVSLPGLALGISILSDKLWGIDGEEDVPQRLLKRKIKVCGKSLTFLLLNQVDKG